ncbi:phage terminase large subunit-like protein [Novosphingobium hassiacum]|uniref:Phage terminase large subunit-like protein n=1 Tax=Novosphingobium hassiacum TaxID=173676 RepID=A0A7W5ZZJ9_9SPHN|nr:terminase family protein [Novosphingobium hassiacum]MBB3862376.1 phage terminase large subunit-like protein [Novosphingobium hassiacum]
MDDAEPLDWMFNASRGEIDDFFARLSEIECREWRWDWNVWGRKSQRAPQGDWRIWLVMAGRGFGKTRLGAEWVRAQAEADPEARIALVAASLHEARSVMVEGESGLLSIGAPWRRPTYESSVRRLVWPNGACAYLYSAGEPESLRGPQHSHAWCDEIAKWDTRPDQGENRALAAWDNLLMGLRLGHDPRLVATTTPRPVPLVARIIGEGEAGGVVLTRGSTFDNTANLPERFIAAMRRTFGRSLLGRQEIHGEMIEDLRGALWSRALIERGREAAAPPCTRIVVAVDPPASAHGDACGIVVCGIGDDRIARVLADCSVEQASPERWARAVADAARAWSADRVVAEANQGGAMVEAVLRAAEASLPLRLVHASRGKSARAEPVAALYEAGRVRHAGMFPKLEDELCGLMPGGEYQGPGRSPDRADACVWALTELMLGRAGEPRIWFD